MASKNGNGRVTKPTPKIEVVRPVVPFDPANINIPSEKMIGALRGQISQMAARHAEETALKDCAIEMLRENIVELTGAVELLRGIIEDADLDAKDSSSDDDKEKAK